MTSKWLALFSALLVFNTSTDRAEGTFDTPPPYVLSRSEAQRRLLKFANTECPVHSSVEAHRPSRRTFKRAIVGDFDALTVVFAACEYQDHSGDERDIFSDRPWELLHTVGDRRFAAYLRSLDPVARKAALRWLLVVRFWYSDYPLADYDRYLRRHFPRVAAFALSSSINHVVQ